MKVETFSIGFGKELFGWNDKHGTHWRVALLPLGGFVKMYGDLDPASAEADPTVKALSESEKSHAFFAKSIPQRAAIVAAGPLINFLFAFIVFFGVFATVGRQYTPPVIDGLVEHYPAAKAGLLQGDVVVSVNNQPIERFQDIGRIVSLWTSGSLPVIIKRGDATMEFSLEPMLAETTNNLGVKGQKPKIGVVSQSSIEFEKVGLVSERVRVGTAAARVLIEHAIRKNVRVRDVLRDMLGLESALAEEVIFEMPLTEEDYRTLAMPYKLRPDHRVEIRSCLEEELRQKLTGIAKH